MMNYLLPTLAGEDLGDGVPYKARSVEVLGECPFVIPVHQTNAFRMIPFLIV